MEHTNSSRRRTGFKALLGTITFVALFSLGAAWRAGWFESHPDVILITLDTMRADRLGCYGYKPANTPTIDRLAREGVLFEKAASPAPLTLPVHASLLTGLYPPEHGLRTNGRGSLPREIPTLAERLRDNGYDTAAFVASFVLHSRFGLDRGFATYDDDLSSGQATPDSLQRQRDGADVVDAALRWLTTSRRQPAFCWVHLYDPHAPYSAHEELFGAEYKDRAYDAEVAYVDRQIRRIIEAIEAQGRSRQTLVILVGDHGEGFSDHVEREHGLTLFESTQRVPMIWWSPGRVPESVRSASRVSVVDVLPTLLDELRITPPTVISGRSLRPTWRGQDLEPRPVFAMTDEPYLQNAWCPLRTLTTDRWKYIRSTIPELYDLEHDPGETKNVIKEQADVARQLESQLAAWEQQSAQNVPGAVKLSADDKRRLKSLGYQADAGSSLVPDDVFSQGLPDVKEMLPIDVEVCEAVEWMRRGRNGDALRRLQEIVLRAPRHVAARVLLGEGYEKADRDDLALANYEKAIDLRPDHVDAWLRIANLVFQQGDANRAAEAFQTVLALDPESAEAHYNLGLLQRRMGQPDEAYKSCQEALRIDPWLLNANAALGTLHAERGDLPAAAAAFETELARNPKSAEAHTNYGVVLARRGESEKAARHLALAVQHAPKSPASHFNLGAFLAGQGKTKEAERFMRRALELDPQNRGARETLNRLKLQTAER